MKVIDLFCGIGGSSTGIEQAGHEVVLAVDFNETVLKSYSTNHKQTEVWQEDITILKVKELPKADIILGSTPCQTFSKANTKTRTCDMSLTNAFLKVIMKVQPKYWALENVRQVMKFLPSDFKQYGRLLNAAHYGTPQTRIRMIAGNYPTPRPTHAKHSSQTLDNKLLHSFVWVSDMLPHLTGRWLCDQRTTKPGPEHHSFFHCDRPSRTVTTKQFCLVKEPRRGAVKERYLDIEEHAIIQGFPAGYKFSHGNKQQRQDMVGNAVPPPIMKAVGIAIKNKEKL